MKKFYINITLILTLISFQWSFVKGQVPYDPPTATKCQAVARDVNGNLITNRTVSLRFTLITDSATGPVYYQETQTATTNEFGLFSVKIYTAVANTNGVFNPAVWKLLATRGAYSKIEIDVNGGTNYVNMGTTQMLYVPFALYAESAGVTPGAVTYKGVWNAITNTPPLSSGIGTSGDLYLVSDASPIPSQNTTLDGNNRYKIGDAVIYNGFIYQCLATSNTPLTALDIPFNPTATITSTNVQNALEEIDSDAKNPANIIQDATHRFVTDAERTSWSGKADKAIPLVAGHFAALDATGNLVDGGKSPSDYLDKNNSTQYSPVNDYNPATKKYVDDNASASQTQVNNKVSKSGDTMTGDLILNASPSTALGAATKQYVDAGDALKLNLAGGTLTGPLVLDANPVSALGAATKQYVDAGDNLKADKAVPLIAGNFATLDLSGNIVDGGAKTSSNIAFSPTPVLQATNVQDAIEEVNGQFADLIDSYIHKLDDGVTIYLPQGGTRKRFGIGDTQPEAPLGIKGDAPGDDEMISMTSANGVHKWNINLNPTSLDVPGFSIDDKSTGTSVSRLFIDQTSDGKIGIGTINPLEKLHIEGAAMNSYVGTKILNTAQVINSGWIMGHFQDATVAHDGAFSILEDMGTAKVERITVLPSQNVGINETLPYATLHVTRPVTDAQRDVALSENTGILLLGPIDDKNLAFDSHQIQARTGSYTGAGATLAFTASTLNLQPHGGDIILHSDNSIAQQVKFSVDGKIGVGKDPIESVDVNGAITIGDASGTTAANGTIRWTGTDFEGRKSGSWVSLTTASSANGIWQQPGGQNTELIYFVPSNQGQALHPKVGIGTNAPTSALQVEDNNSSVSNADAVTMRAISQSTLLTSTSNNRIGLELSNSNTWSSNASSRDIGLYVSNVSGQSSHSSNLAAVLNGNTVIGDLTGSPVVGTNGRNVLAIQTGDVPVSAIGSTTNGGIQIYAETDAIGTSVFHVMNGDGTVMQLYRAPALTPTDISTVSSTTYGSTEADVINNLRTRLNELEARLQTLGLLY